jgi:hypothetical protein
MITTLADAEAVFGTAHLDHLDRAAEIPVVTTSACQGDVSILRVTTGAAVTPVPADGVAVVRGEDGGHTHALFGDGPVSWDAAEPVPGSLVLGTLTVPEGSHALLSHPEHGGLLVAPGTYRVGRQREFGGEWRLVAD